MQSFIINSSSKHPTENLNDRAMTMCAMSTVSKDDDENEVLSNQELQKGKQSYASKLLPIEFALSDKDVLCGRGSRCFNHKGNKMFRKLVEANLEQYSKATTKNEKTSIICEIINYVRSCSPDGGFVKQDLDSGRYFEVGDFHAREKTSQAFRDALQDQYKSSYVARNKTRKLRCQNRLLLSQLLSANSIELSKANLERLESLHNAHNREEICSSINQATNANEFQDVDSRLKGWSELRKGNDNDNQDNKNLHGRACSTSTELYRSVQESGMELEHHREHLWDELLENSTFSHHRPNDSASFYMRPNQKAQVDISPITDRNQFVWETPCTSTLHPHNYDRIENVSAPACMPAASSITVEPPLDQNAKLLRDASENGTTQDLCNFKSEESSHTPSDCDEDRMLFERLFRLTQAYDSYIDTNTSLEPNPLP